jgi:hypothetical protein
MIATIKQAIEKEFKANGIELTARVKEYSYQANRVLNYQIELLYGDSRNFMRIFCNASAPFQPKVLPISFIEPHKMIKLCEIIMEAFKNLDQSQSQ